MKILNEKITKIEIKETISLAKDALENPKKYACLAGVSLGAKHYSYKPNVKSYINFLIRYFDKVLIFINDYNYHWDLMAFQNLSKRQAIEKAKRMGEELKNNYQNIITKFFPKEGYKFKIVTFFELLKNKKFQDFQKKFHKILQQNNGIKEEIEKDLDNQIFYTCSIKEKLETIKKDTPFFYQSAIRFAKNHILDQLIANLYLIFKQPTIYNIRVSPTPYKYFLTLRKTLEDKYGNLRKKLEIKEKSGYLGICLPNQNF